MDHMHNSRSLAVVGQWLYWNTVTGSGVHNINRHPGLPPKHQVEWSVSSGGMDAGVVCHAQPSQVVLPLEWLFFDCSSEHREESSVTPYLSTSPSDWG